MTEHKRKEPLNLRSEDVQEILSNPPIWIIRWGITLVFVFTVLIFSLSFLIRYPDFVPAKVVVTTEQPTERVIAKYSAPLDKIWISNKDTVRMGQPLALLRNGAVAKHINILKDHIESISFEVNGFTFPIESTAQLNFGDVETAYANFERSYVNYVLLKDLNPYENQILSNTKSLSEIQLRLVDLIKKKELIEQEYELKQSEFSRYRQLYERGVVSEQEFELKELEFIQIQKNINDMSISISQMREAISSANQTIRSTKISSQEDNTRFVNNMAQSYNSLKKAIRDWEDTYLLRSSIDGVVSFQEYWGVNQYVNSGDHVFSILPLDTQNLVGKLSLPAQNAGKVTVDQKVLVKLDNFPYQQYGALVGKVKNISISPDQEGNYVIYISLPEGVKTSYGKNLGFSQELLGNAEIITEDLSVAQRLFHSFNDLIR